MKIKSIAIGRLIEGPSMRAADERPEAVMVSSIRTRGLINPLTVRRLPRSGWFWFLRRSRYQVVDGIHRLRACRRVGLSSVPCNVLSLTDQQVLQAQIIASSPRVRTSRTDMARALRKIMQANPGMTVEQVAEKIDQSPEWVRGVLEEYP